MNGGSHKKGTAFLIVGIAAVVVLLISILAISHTVSKKSNQKESEVTVSGNEGIATESGIQIETPVGGLTLPADWKDSVEVKNNLSSDRGTVDFYAKAAGESVKLFSLDFGEEQNGYLVGRVPATDGSLVSVYLDISALTKKKSWTDQDFTTLNDLQSGVNDLLLSVDAFHQEHIPLDPVFHFAKNAVQAGILVRLQPAWLVSPEDPNPYNNRTWEVIQKFDPLHISLNQGNVIFPSGNALKYLCEYFDENTTVSNPYEEDPEDVKTISFEPDGSVLKGNVYQTDILEIMEHYKP